MEFAGDIELNQQVTFVVKDGGEVVLSRAVAEKMPIIPGIIERFEGASVGAEIPSFAQVPDDLEDVRGLKGTVLKTVISIVKEIYTDTPVLKWDPLFFGKTDVHPVYTPEDIPQQVRKIIKRKVGEQERNAVSQAADVLGFSWIVDTINNLQSTAKSIADIVEYGPLFDFFDDANIKLSFADSNVVSFAGIRLLYDEILRSTNVDTPVLTLDFSRNQIQMLPEDALSGLEYITSLNLRSNAIKKIKSDAFSGASQLQYVDLSDNQIETIESDAFVDLSNIRELDLSNNQIKTIPEEAFGDIGLGLAWKLNISGNNLDEDNKARLQNALPNVIITF
jgi:hypothetical protein